MTFKKKKLRKKRKNDVQKNETEEKLSIREINEWNGINKRERKKRFLSLR